MATCGRRATKIHRRPRRSNRDGFSTGSRRRALALGAAREGGREALTESKGGLGESAPEDHLPTEGDPCFNVKKHDRVLTSS